MAKERPNIILVTLHDLGSQLAVYDRDLPATPNISRIADEGVVFESHFSTCPLCSPARASIQTGRYPHSNGMNGLTHRGFSLAPDEKCLPQYFNELGYHTALYGFQHEVEGDPARLGYREVRSRPDFPTGAVEIMPRVVRFLERPPEPFFLTIGFTQVHRPFQHKYARPVEPSTVKVPPYLPDWPEVRQDWADFYGSLLSADGAIQPLLESLDRAGLREKTLLLFTTDHGAAFPRAKSTLYDPGIGVALLMRWPSVIPPGGRARGLTSHVDLLPTLLEVAGGKVPENVQGRSLVPFLSDPGARGRDRVFAEKSWHGNEYDPMRCVRTERFKYIRNFTEGFLYQSPLDIKASLSGRAMEPLRRKPRAMTELYDLRADPLERRNLSGDPAAAQIEAKCRRELEAWMRSTGDPLPGAPIPWPQPGKRHYLNNMDAPMQED